MKIAVLKIKYQVILCIFSICCIFSAFYILILIPQQNEIAELKNLKQVNDNKIELVEKFAVSHPDINEYDHEIQVNLDNVNKKIPDKYDISNFLAQIKQISQVTNVELLHVKPRSPVSKDNYTCMLVDVEVKGDYFQTINFLKKLKEVERFNSVNKMLMQSSNEFLKTKLEINIYSYGKSTEDNQDQISFQFTANP
ncbi:MAG: Pilus assembly protein PilO [Firmicutes bacterium]|nr:Pilus assembly protein PilO [Bacillota bacterium]